MIILNLASELNDQLGQSRKESKKIGFVPTMGALHQGHLSLIDSSRVNNQVTVCSIFVNPAQFNDPKDFEKYPVTLEKDLEFLEKAGTDVVFIPTVSEMYPGGFHDLQTFDLGYLDSILEGKYRPGHFQGVAQVMSRLIIMVRPDSLYMGQKDYQQCMVIRRLIQIMGLEYEIQFNICPTMREEDGLAMSSRNLRLSPDERMRAVAIYQSLNHIRENLRIGDLSKIKIEAVDFLQSRDFKVDYVEIAQAEDLHLVDKWDGKTELVVLAAAFLNQVRLIDNLKIS